MMSDCIDLPRHQALWAGQRIGWMQRETLKSCVAKLDAGKEPIAQDDRDKPCHPTVIRSLRARGLLQTELKVATKSGPGVGSYTRLVVVAATDADGAVHRVAPTTSDTQEASS